MRQDNPLFQLLTDTPEKNNLMFFTPYNEDSSIQREALRKHYCCLCGVRELMLVPINVQQTISKCFSCYELKLKFNMEIKKKDYPLN